MKDDIADGNFEIGLLWSTQFHRFDRLHNSGDILRPVGGNDRLHEVAHLRGYAREIALTEAERAALPTLSISPVCGQAT